MYNKDGQWVTGRGQAIAPTMDVKADQEGVHRP